jgi:exodeoxyribonuclease V beta subunit
MTTLLPVAAFDVCGELPTGTTVLEASAGTGKTFTIASLAVRYVAEGHAELPELMLVTFGREATQELRERVRERLGAVERALRDPAAARASTDEVTALLARVDDAEVVRRRERLTRSLAQFDAATIATTHQFCQQMLAGLGVAGDRDADARFVESVEDLLTEVVDDFYVRKYGDRAAGTPAFSRKEALELARVAVHDEQARLEPRDAEAGSTAEVRFRFASAVRGEVARRKREQRIYTYDDMLTRLAAALADPARGAAERLRARFRVVLVDEFQDTDPVQWDILRRAFHGHTTLVLIGDPKQAIYAFRGADVRSYLDATEVADAHSTLATNWRSDAPLLDALAQVYGDVALGNERITVHPVGAAHVGQRVPGVPLRVRVLGRAGLPAAKSGLVFAAEARREVAADAAADIAELVAGGTVQPGDIAVLVRTNDQGTLVHAALRRAGVPAVLSGTASVFGTPVAREWLYLLEACEAPRAVRLRGAALTCFLGHTVDELCGPDADQLLDRIGVRLRAWGALLRERGVAALLEAVTTDTGLPERLLRLTGGERTLTDLRHIGQALHEAAGAGHLGPAALVDWLGHRIREAAPGSRAEVGTERSRRLESDAAAVQIITIHRSKGLEFPVVYVPFGWDRNVRDPEVPLLHDASGARVLDVGGPSGERFRDHAAAHRFEEAGEDLRLFYVALTRARSRVVTWWVPATTTSTSPVHRLLLGRTAPGTVPEQSYRIPADNAAVIALRALESPVLAVEQVAPRLATAPAARSDRAPSLLVAARFERELDLRWRRTSYSALTAGVDHAPAGVASEADARGTDDEPGVDPGIDAARDAPPVDEHDVEVPAPAGSAAAAIPSPMAELPMGAGFGTLVHAVFEAADLTAPDLTAELLAHCRAQLARHPVPGLDMEVLAAALRPSMETPLGPLADGLRLADIAPRDRLSELDFELPLAGGDAPRPVEVRLGDVAPLLRRHLPAADPLASYAEVLLDPELAEQPLRGYLTGSIDAVLRLPGSRFAVVDYKTNWLGAGRDEPLTAAHYLPPLLARAMIAANYPLQALLYCVALHRYLRWRLPGYSPERHLGGVLYLFVRGMCGPTTPTVDDVPCGVFSWHPPAALVVELSALLDGS